MHSKKQKKQGADSRFKKRKERWGSPRCTVVFELKGSGKVS